VCDRAKNQQTTRRTDKRAGLMWVRYLLDDCHCGLGVRASVSLLKPGKTIRGDGGIRTRDGGFADPCLNHLATSPKRIEQLFSEPAPVQLVIILPHVLS
jgi:hypothetical protein